MCGACLQANRTDSVAYAVQNVAKFQVVATIPEESLKAQIHTTFRLGYIKDAALLRMLDDITIAAFTLILIPVAPVNIRTMPDI
jgi:hypothetical protein